MNRLPKPTYEQSQQDTIDRLIEENEKLKELLKMSKCPHCNGSGEYYVGYGNVERCRWCFEIEEILKEKP